MGMQRCATRRYVEQEWIRILGKAEVPPREVLPESEMVHEYYNRKLVKYGQLILHMPIQMVSDRVNKVIRVYRSEISSLCLLIFVSFPCLFL
jgi:hypothetical protein